MKKGRFWISLLASSLFALALVAQASRFADLRAKAKALEKRQETALAEIRELEADIAQLSSRERTDAMAARLGLKRIQPEETLRVLVDPTLLKPQARPGGESAQAKGVLSHD